MKMKYEKQISKAIKKISKESGLSYGQIAIKLGISKSGVNNWVWRNQMPIDSMLKVCEVFGLEITDFLKPEEGKEKIDVVRCKDCKWWDRKTTYKDGTIITDCKRGLMANENGFCIFGERREE